MLEVKKKDSLLLLQMKKPVLARPSEVDPTAGQPRKLYGRCAQGRKTDDGAPEHPDRCSVGCPDSPGPHPRPSPPRMWKQHEEKGTVLRS